MAQIRNYGVSPTKQEQFSSTTIFEHFFEDSGTKLCAQCRKGEEKEATECVLAMGVLVSNQEMTHLTSKVLYILFMQPLSNRNNKEMEAQAALVEDNDLILDRRGTILPGQASDTGDEIDTNKSSKTLMHFFNHVNQMSEVYDTTRLVLAIVASLSSTLLVEANPSLREVDDEETETESGAITPDNASHLICSFINSDLVPLHGLEAIGSKILHSSALRNAANTSSLASSKREIKGGKKPIRSSNDNPGNSEAVMAVVHLLMQKHGSLFDSLVDNALSRFSGGDSGDSNENLRAFLKEVFVDAPYRAPIDSGSTPHALSYAPLTDGACASAGGFRGACT